MFSNTSITTYLLIVLFRSIYPYAIVFYGFDRVYLLIKDFH